MTNRRQTGVRWPCVPSRSMLASLACLALALPACRDEAGETGKVTRSSIEAYEQGLRQVESGDIDAARASFAAAVEEGGLQPDLYCEARFQQARCEAELGDFDAAISILEQLATGAPDLDRINDSLASIRARRAAATAVNSPGGGDETPPRAADSQ